MAQHSRVVRNLRRKDILCIGPDVTIRVCDDPGEMRLSIDADRRMAIFREVPSRPQSDPVKLEGPMRRNVKDLRSGDVFYLGPDCIIKVLNEPNVCMRVIIKAARHMQIHHQKTETPPLPEPAVRQG